VNRLQPYYLLLVIVPALAFAAGGLVVAGWSRSTLDPLILQEAARQAVAYVSAYRWEMRNRIGGSPGQLTASAAALGIERYTVYDEDGAVVESFPDDLDPLRLELTSPNASAMLAAARRGATVVDLVRRDDETLWAAYVPGEGRMAVALWQPRRELAQSFWEATGFELAVYHRGRRFAAAGLGWPRTLPGEMADSLADLDRALAGHLSGMDVGIAPLKDFDDWDMIGAVAVTAGQSAPAVPGLPRVPVLAMLFGAALTAIAVWRLGGHAAEPRPQAGLRRAFALALLPPAAAAVWMARGDSDVTARATDAVLELGARLIATVEAPDRLAAGRLAALTGADIALLQGDTVAASSGIAVSGQALSRLEPLWGRAALDGRRLAYRAIPLASGARLFLFRTPLEDSRKATIFWLAALYGILAAALLVFASFAYSARSRLELRETATAWGFIGPSLVLLLTFSAAPLLFAFYLSFHNWNLLEPAKPFVGLQHYLRLAGDGLFWKAALNTALYSLYVPASMACALAVAMLLNRKIRGVALLRAVFFLPYITSFVAVSIVWQWMYDPQFGLINWLLGLVELGPFPWLSSPATALIALMIMAVWIHIGFQMVIFLAGLQAIPEELYEAAMIDGAGPWRRFRRITLPLLKPTTFFVLVTSVIGSFQVFTFVYVMTEGGPLHATDVIVYHIYQNAWQFLRMGYASAMSWVLFAVIFAITLLQFRFLGRRLTPQ
jgi:multiple sugar transport system permease protein